jgi:hypothetical protein
MMDVLTRYGSLRRSIFFERPGQGNKKAPEARCPSMEIHNSML